MNPAVEGSEHVGPYRLLKAIGAGGSARIDLARIERAYGFQRHVVIKRPLEHLRKDAGVSTSLRREASLGGRLTHPNLVAVLDAGTHEGYDYLALEYVHGATLRTLMHADAGAVRAVPLPSALAIVIDIARGLHVAHELTAPDGTPLGLVHRDVSPSNVLLGADGTVKLADFGIAKDTRVTTLSGSMRGTVTYMAPEQCRGHAFDRRADVFSLGVILYELVTSRRLFWADNDVASLHKVLSGTVPDPRTLVPGLAPELAAILLAAVAADPEARIATADDLADALEEFAAGVGVSTGARAIAVTMADLLGVRAAPWIETTGGPTDTMAKVEAEREPSLVGVIEGSTDVPEEPLGTAYGPTEDAPAAVATPPRPAARVVEVRPTAPAKRRSGAIALGLVIALCSAAGLALALHFARGDEPPAPPRSAPKVDPPPAPTPALAPPAAAGSAVVAPVDEPGVAPVDEPGLEPGVEPGVEIDPAGSSAGSAKQRPRKRRPPPPVAPVTAVAPPDAGVLAPVIDASATAHSVEWTPTLLLPTDKQKGTK